LATNLSLTARVRILQCPNCKQTTNTSVQQCPYCSTPIDPGAAEAAADIMERVNQGCSDSSFLRTMVATMWGCVGLGLVPFVSLIGTLGSWILFFAVPAMAIRWWFKFGAIVANDSDFARAKRSVMLTVGIWAILPILFLVARMVR